MGMANRKDANQTAQGTAATRPAQRSASASKRATMMRHTNTSRKVTPLTRRVAAISVLAMGLSYLNAAILPAPPAEAVYGETCTEWENQPAILGGVLLDGNFCHNTAATVTYANRAAFPGTPSSGDQNKVFVAADTGIAYRWDTTISPANYIQTGHIASGLPNGQQYLDWRDMVLQGTQMPTVNNIITLYYPGTTEEIGMLINDRSPENSTYSGGTEGTISQNRLPDGTVPANPYAILSTDDVQNNLMNNIGVDVRWAAVAVTYEDSWRNGVVNPSAQLHTSMLINDVNGEHNALYAIEVNQLPDKDGLPNRSLGDLRLMMHYFGNGGATTITPIAHVWQPLRGWPSPGESTHFLCNTDPTYWPPTLGEKPAGWGTPPNTAPIDPCGWVPLPNTSLMGQNGEQRSVWQSRTDARTNTNQNIIGGNVYKGQNGDMIIEASFEIADLLAANGLAMPNYANLSIRSINVPTGNNNMCKNIDKAPGRFPSNVATSRCITDYNAQDELAALAAGQPYYWGGYYWDLEDRIGPMVIKLNSPYSTSVDVLKLERTLNQRESASLIWGTNYGGHTPGEVATGWILPNTSLLETTAGYPDGLYFKQVQGGIDHVVALGSDGKVYTAGHNDAGQLGRSVDPSLIDEKFTAVPGLPANIIAIAAGYKHTLALTDDGHIYAWGANFYGQIGNGNVADQFAPVLLDDAVTNTSLPGGRTAVAIGAGDGHSLAIASDGTVWAWGNGQFGRLGNGTNDAVISALDANAQVMLGANAPLNVDTQDGGGSIAPQIVGGYEHSLVLTKAGTVYAFGRNIDGRLGIGGATDAEATTTKAYATKVAMPSGVTVKQIAAGDRHSVALSTAGDVYTWGMGESGQLGQPGWNANPVVLSVVQASYTPKRVAGLESFTDVNGAVASHAVTQIAARGAHTVALVQFPTHNGAAAYTAAYGFGDNRNGQLGSGTQTVDATCLPTAGCVSELLGSIGATYLGASESSTLLTFTFTPSSVVEWGRVAGAYRQPAELDHLSVTSECKVSTKLIRNPWRYLKPGGTVEFVDGYDDPVDHQLNGKCEDGAGTEKWFALGTESPATEQLISPSNKPGFSNTSLYRFSLNARLPDDFNSVTDPYPTVNIWYAPAVATGSTYADGTPVMIPNPTRSTWTSAGTRIVSSEDPVAVRGVTEHMVDPSQYLLVIETTGPVWINNVTTMAVDAGVLPPAEVVLPDPAGADPASPVIEVVGGDDHLLARDAYDHVWAWGYNAYGQLGDGTTNDHFGINDWIEVPKAWATGITQLSAGFDFSLLLADDGRVWAWGNNEYGQLSSGCADTMCTNPVVVTFPAGVRIVSIEAGDIHSLAIDSNGNVWSWGYAERGALGTTTAMGIAPFSIELAGMGLPTDSPFCVAAGDAVKDFIGDGSSGDWSAAISEQFGPDYQPELGDGTPTGCYLSADDWQQNAPLTEPAPLPEVLPTMVETRVLARALELAEEKAELKAAEEAALADQLEEESDLTGLVTTSKPAAQAPATDVTEVPSVIEPDVSTEPDEAETDEAPSRITNAINQALRWVRPIFQNGWLITPFEIDEGGEPESDSLPAHNTYLNNEPSDPAVGESDDGSASTPEQAGDGDQTGTETGPDESTDPGNSAETTEPDPDQPEVTDPEGSTDPAEVTDPEQGTDPEDGTAPEEGTDPEQVTDPEAGTDTAEVTDPEEGTDTEEGTDPEQATDLEDEEETEAEEEEELELLDPELADFLVSGDPLDVRIGIDFAQPGLSYVDPEHIVADLYCDEAGNCYDGIEGAEPAGLQVSLAEFVVDRLFPGARITWYGITSENSQAALGAGESSAQMVDFVFATYQAVESSLERIDLVGPFFKLEQDLLFREDDPQFAQVVENPEPATAVVIPEVVTPGSTSCVVTDSDAAAALVAEGIDEADIFATDNLEDCAQLLAAGRVDAVMGYDFELFAMAGSQAITGDYNPGMVQFGSAPSCPNAGCLNFIQVSGGWEFSLGLTADGKVYGWGQGYAGQIGPNADYDPADASTGTLNGSYGESFVPVEIPFADLPAGTKIVKVSAADEHAIALDSDGNVWAWGANEFGQLGLTSTQLDTCHHPTDFDYPFCDVPQQVGKPAGVTKFIDITTGYNDRGGHSHALAANGDIWSWGSNDTGAIGDGTLNDAPLPTKTIFPASFGAQSFAGGASVLMALGMADSRQAPTDQLGNGWLFTSSHMDRLVNTGAEQQTTGSYRGEVCPGVKFGEYCNVPDSHWVGPEATGHYEVTDGLAHYELNPMWLFDNAGQITLRESIPNSDALGTCLDVDNNEVVGFNNKAACEASGTTEDPHRWQSDWSLLPQNGQNTYCEHLSGSTQPAGEPVKAGAYHDQDLVFRNGKWEHSGSVLNDGFTIDDVVADMNVLCTVVNTVPQTTVLRAVMLSWQGGYEQGYNWELTKVIDETVDPVSGKTKAELAGMIFIEDDNQGNGHWQAEPGTTVPYLITATPTFDAGSEYQAWGIAQVTNPSAAAENAAGIRLRLAWTDAAGQPQQRYEGAVAWRLAGTTAWSDGGTDTTLGSGELTPLADLIIPAGATIDIRLLWHDADEPTSPVAAFVEPVGSQPTSKNVDFDQVDPALVGGKARVDDNFDTQILAQITKLGLDPVTALPIREPSVGQFLADIPAARQLSNGDWEAVDPYVWEYTEQAPSAADLPEGTCRDVINLTTLTPLDAVDSPMLDQQQIDSAKFNVCHSTNLAVRATVHGEYSGALDWEIEKNVVEITGDGHCETDKLDADDPSVTILGTGDDCNDDPWFVSQEQVLKNMHFATIDGGGQHSVGLTEDGRVFTWGRNNSGQLGINSTVASVDAPVEVTFPGQFCRISANPGAGTPAAVELDETPQSCVDQGGQWLPQVSSVSAGTESTFAVLQRLDMDNITTAITVIGADLYAWGAGSHGQLGNGTLERSRAPRLVEFEPALDDLCTGTTGSYYTRDDCDGAGGTWHGQSDSGFPIQGKVESVAAGGYRTVAFTCVDKTNGEYCSSSTLEANRSTSLWAWGDNGSGRLGDGTIDNQTTPVRVLRPLGNNSRIISIKVGAEHTLALDDEGKVWAWGSNLNGRLGQSENTAFSCAVGTVAGGGQPTYCADNNINTTTGFSVLAVEVQFNDPTNVLTTHKIVTIEAGDDFSLALDAQGNVWGWGSNEKGQLSEWRTLPPWVGTPVMINVPSVGIFGHVTEIAAAGSHAHAVVKDMSSPPQYILYGWGDNTDQALGADLPAKVVWPTVISIPADANWQITGVAAGTQHSHAIISAGGFWSYGSNTYGQLGLGGHDAGFYTTKAGSDGKATFGYQIVVTPKEQLGEEYKLNGTVTVDNPNEWPVLTELRLLFHQTFPALAPGAASDVVCSIDTPAESAIPLAEITLPVVTATEDSTLVTGETRRREFSDAATRAACLQDSTCDLAAAGAFHSAAIDEFGNLWTWGRNHVGQLGVTLSGGALETREPQLVVFKDAANNALSPQPQIIKVAAGASHTLALAADGTLWAFGDNTYGQLGTGDFVRWETPTPVDITNAWDPADWEIVAISAGNSHSVVLLKSADGKDSAVWAFGSGGAGKLGLGTNIANHATPVEVTFEDWATSFETATDLVTSLNFTNHALGAAVAADYAPWEKSGSPTLEFVADPFPVAAGDEALRITRSQNHDSLNSPIGLLLPGETYHIKFKVMLDPADTSVPSTTEVKAHVQAVDADRNMWGARLGETTITKSGWTTIDIPDYRVAADGDFGNTDARQLTFQATTALGIPFQILVSQLSVEHVVTGGIIDVVAGGEHTLALAQDGRVWAWGDGGSGRLGNNDPEETPKGTPVSAQFPVLPAGVKITQIAAGEAHSLALDKTGNVWAWGSGDHGQTGLISGGQPLANVWVPTQLPTLSGIGYISAGGDGSHAAGTGGLPAYVWGNVQMGVNWSEPGVFPIDVGIGGIGHLYASIGHVMAVSDDGHGYAFGTNDFDQLGNGWIPPRWLLSSATQQVCTDDQYITAAACRAAGEEWLLSSGTEQVCTDDQYTTADDCRNAGEQWVARRTLEYTCRIPDGIVPQGWVEISTTWDQSSNHTYGAINNDYHGSDPGSLPQTDGKNCLVEYEDSDPLSECQEWQTSVALATLPGYTVQVNDNQFTPPNTAPWAECVWNWDDVAKAGTPCVYDYELDHNNPWPAGEQRWINKAELVDAKTKRPLPYFDSETVQVTSDELKALVDLEPNFAVDYDWQIDKQVRNICPLDYPYNSANPLDYAAAASALRTYQGVEHPYSTVVDPVSGKLVTLDFQDAANLLRGWNSNGGVTMTQHVDPDSIAAAAGNQVLQIPVSQQYEGLQTPRSGAAALQPGKAYTFSARIRLADYLVDGSPSTRDTATARFQVTNEGYSGIVGSPVYYHLTANGTQGVEIKRDEWITITGEWAGSADPGYVFRILPGDPVSPPYVILVDDVVITEDYDGYQKDIVGFKDVYEFPVGVAVQPETTVGNAGEAVLKHFDQVVAENDMKPGTWYVGSTFRGLSNAAKAILAFVAPAVPSVIDPAMPAQPEPRLGLYGHTLVYDNIDYQSPGHLFLGGTALVEQVAWNALTNAKFNTAALGATVGTLSSGELPGLQNSGGPTYTIVPGTTSGNNALQVSGRANTWDAVDVKVSEFGLNLAANSYTLVLSVRFVGAPADSQLVISNPANYAWLATSEPVTGDASVQLALPLDSTIPIYRIQTNEEGKTATFIIDNIEIKGLDLPTTETVVFQRDFEDGVVATGDGGTMAIVTDPLGTQGQVQSVTTSASWHGVNIPASAFEPGATYRFQADVLRPVSSSAMNARFEGADDPWPWVVGNTAIQNNKWTTISGEYTWDPVNPMTVHLVNGGAGQFFVDNIVITKIVKAKPQADEVRENLVNHIKNVAKAITDAYGPFGSDTNPFTAWEVVNEAIANDGSGLRTDSRWQQILGDDYVSQAFQLADFYINGQFHTKCAASWNDAADAFRWNTLSGRHVLESDYGVNRCRAENAAQGRIDLYINDYGAEDLNEGASSKGAAYYALVKSLVDAGVPIDGVGHQMHLTTSSDLSQVQAALAKFSDLGLKQAVTELDVELAGSADEDVQAVVYRDLFHIFNEFYLAGTASGAIGSQLAFVNLWGLSDNRSWHQAQKPTLFDHYLQAKPAFFGAGGYNVDSLGDPIASEANALGGSAGWCDAWSGKAEQWQVPGDEGDFDYQVVVESSKTVSGNLGENTTITNPNLFAVSLGEHLAEGYRGVLIHTTPGAQVTAVPTVAHCADSQYLTELACTAAGETWYGGNCPSGACTYALEQLTNASGAPILNQEGLTTWRFTAGSDPRLAGGQSLHIQVTLASTSLGAGQQVVVKVEATTPDHNNVCDYAGCRASVVFDPTKPGVVATDQLALLTDTLHDAAKVTANGTAPRLLTARCADSQYLTEQACTTAGETWYDDGVILRDWATSGTLDAEDHLGQSIAYRYSLGLDDERLAAHSNQAAGDKFPNTATLTPQGLNASGALTAQAEAVVHHGQDLTVSKDMWQSFTRQYNWEIEKLVRVPAGTPITNVSGDPVDPAACEDGYCEYQVTDPLTQLGDATGQATFEYLVKAIAGSTEDYNWVMTGTIEANNPNPFPVWVVIDENPVFGDAATCTITAYEKYSNNGASTTDRVPVDRIGQTTGTCSIAGQTTESDCDIAGGVWTPPFDDPNFRLVGGEPQLLLDAAWTSGSSQAFAYYSCVVKNDTKIKWESGKPLFQPANSSVWLADENIATLAYSVGETYSACTTASLAAGTCTAASAAVGYEELRAFEDPVDDTVTIVDDFAGQPTPQIATTGGAFGYCSDAQYHSESACTTGGGVWYSGDPTCQWGSGKVCKFTYPLTLTGIDHQDPYRNVAKLIGDDSGLELDEDDEYVKVIAEFDIELDKVSQGGNWLTDTEFALYRDGTCSDGTSATEADCLAANHTWQTGTCSDGTSTTAAACAANSGTWGAGSGVCSDGTSTTEATCLTGNKTWTHGVGSLVEGGRCSGAVGANPGVCATNGGTWKNFGLTEDLPAQPGRFLATVYPGIYWVRELKTHQGYSLQATDIPIKVDTSGQVTVLSTELLLAGAQVTEAICLANNGTWNAGTSTCTGGTLDSASAYVGRCMIDTDPTPAVELVETPERYPSKAACQAAAKVNPNIQWTSGGKGHLVVVNYLARQLPLVGSVPGGYWWLMFLGAGLAAYAVIAKTRSRRLSLSKP